jgi:hypothetical protein
LYKLLREFAVKEFFSYKSLNARKGKIKYRQATYKICRRVFFVLRVPQVKKAKDFLSDKLHTRARTWKPLSPPGLVCRQKRGREKEKKKTKEGGLSPQEGDVRKKKRKRPRKARRWLREGKVPCALNQEILFLVHEYLGLEAAHLV